MGEDVGSLEGIGYAYQHEWYHKFLMDADENNTKIAYISDDYDIPCVRILVRTEHRDLDVDVAVEGSYHVSGSDLDIVTLDGLWYISGNVQNALYDIDKCFQLEVIGNIFDNPELLEMGV